MKISVIVPAYNEQDLLEQTLQSIRQSLDSPCFHPYEVIVVDDGSEDETSYIAKAYTDKLITNRENQGKGASLWNGVEQAEGEVIVFLDADLGESASNVTHLLQPVLEQEADMAIAQLPNAQKKAGFGLVIRLATYGIAKLSGYKARAPLSGQRALTRKVLDEVGGLSDGFGIEVGLTIDAVRKGFRVVEVPVSFCHRETGRDLKGFIHRGKEFYWVGRTLLRKWKTIQY